ncbi:ABC transporter permease [Sporolactobacillus laevolacticus]|uniref:Transport permease protein n=1 Tax=Sporolactobacillus laevolacticus DSM 442 TaxID=1395513 RepID=V6J186_9BACL|nr:ABC transporter permease [Sporolactobacillus laevolacticus]EST13602.1 teichoic acid ABC transporter permease [Sporolactobacillus laevolacticus DSM 442]
MKSAWKVIREQFKNLYLISRLSLYELKSENTNNYLGTAWVVINPLIQIFIYWLVFGKILGRNKDIPVDNGQFAPYIIWLISGIIVWFFIQPAIIQGSKSIYSRIRFIAKMNFPMSAIPSYVILEKFYQHLMITGIVFVILQFTKYHVSVYIIQLPYFMFAALAFLFSVSLITSTLSTIVRDVHQILISIMRMLFYLTPFLWEPARLTAAGMPGYIEKILLLNPMYYLVQGYRSTLLGASWYGLDHIWYTAYFWGFVLVALLFGSAIHLRFRDHFVDYL